MKIMFWTKSTSGDYNADISHAYLVIGDELLLEIVTRAMMLVDVVKRDKKTNHIEFRGNDVIWLDDSHDVEMADDGDEYEVRDTDPGFTFDDCASVEVDHTVIARSGVWFSCSPKHADVYLSTPILYYEDIAKAFGEERFQKITGESVGRFMSKIKEMGM